MMRPGESKRLKSNQSFNALVDHSITDVSYNMLCRIAMFLVRNILQYLYCKVKSLWCTWFQGIKFCSRSSTNPRFAKFKTVKTEPQLIICKSLGKEELKRNRELQICNINPHYFFLVSSYVLRISGKTKSSPCYES